MRKTLVLASVISTSILFAQTPAPTVPGPDGSFGSQSWTGTLIDASCSDVSALRNSPTSASAAANIPQTGDTVATARTTPSTDPVMKEVDKTRGRTETRPNTSSTASHETNRTGSTKEANQPYTGDTTSSGTQSAASRASTSSSTAASESTRSRTADPTRPAGFPERGASPISPGASPSAGTSAISVAVPDMQRCQVTSVTNRYALWSNNQVYFFDEASNTQISQQLQSDAKLKNSVATGTVATMPVTITGSMSGNKIRLSSIQVQ